MGSGALLSLVGDRVMPYEKQSLSMVEIYRRAYPCEHKRPIRAIHF